MKFLGGFLVLAGTAAFTVALWALVRGGLRWPSIPNRKAASGVLAGAVLTFGVGGALSPAPEHRSVPAGDTTRTTVFRTATTATTAVTVAAPPATTGAACDSHYPDVCVPFAPPDLDCSDIPYKRFRVLAGDPHGFDGSDNDGLGCES